MKVEISNKETLNRWIDGCVKFWSRLKSSLITVAGLPYRFRSFWRLALSSSSLQAKPQMNLLAFLVVSIWRWVIFLATKMGWLWNAAWNKPNHMFHFNMFPSNSSILNHFSHDFWLLDFFDVMLWFDGLKMAFSCVEFRVVVKGRLLWPAFCRWGFVANLKIMLLICWERWS